MRVEQIVPTRPHDRKRKYTRAFSHIVRWGASLAISGNYLRQRHSTRNGLHARMYTASENVHVCSPHCPKLARTTIPTTPPSRMCRRTASAGAPGLAHDGALAPFAEIKRRPHLYRVTRSILFEALPYTPSTAMTLARAARQRSSFKGWYSGSSQNALRAS